MDTIRKKFDLSAIQEQILSVSCSDNIAQVRGLVSERLKSVQEILSDFNARSIKTMNSLSANLKKKQDVLADLDPNRIKVIEEAEKFLVTAESIVYLQIQKKLELCENFFNMLKNDDLLTASLIARAIHELAAFSAWITTKVTKKINTIKKQIEPKKLTKELTDGVKILERVYYASSDQSIYNIIRIEDARKEYRKKFPEFIEKGMEEKNYNKLCNYVHPNYGSNSLFGDGELTEMKYNDPKIVKGNHTLYLTNITTINIKLMRTSLDDYQETFNDFSILADRLFDQKIKIQNIFKDPKRTFPPEQDGLTIKTAFDLSNIKGGYPEKMNVEAQILSDLGLTSLMQEVVYDNGFMFDKNKTENGMRFFKMGLKDKIMEEFFLESQISKIAPFGLLNKK